MDANLKFKAENVLFRLTYTSVIFAMASIQIDFFFIYLTVDSQNRCKFEILINRFWSAELACFWFRQAGEQCCRRRQSWNVKRARVSPGFWIVSYMNFKGNSLWENSESVIIILSNIQSAINLTPIVVVFKITVLVFYLLHNNYFTY